MDFELNDDQKMLRDTVASFVKQNSPLERFRKLRDDEVGFEASMFQQMSELGWLQVAFPERVGGYEGSFVELSLILEQFGTTLVPEPFVSSVILGGMTLLHAGDAGQHERFLTPMLEGQQTLALAYAEAQSRYDLGSVTTRAVASEGGYKLSGSKRFVLDGHHADRIVVSAMTEDAGLGLFVVDKDAQGLKRAPIKTIDGRRAANLELSEVQVSADRKLGGDARATLEQVIDMGAAAACAEGLGIAKTVLAMTVEYLKTREQFGTKIGRFQALQHRAAEMFVEVELIRSMSIMAAVSVNAPERASAISAAKAQLAMSGRFVTQQSVQLHGGIGVTDEADVGLYFKRMHALNALFGDEAHHVARFAGAQSAAAAV